MCLSWSHYFKHSYSCFTNNSACILSSKVSFPTGCHLLICVAGDDHDGVSVGEPHVAQVAVALQELLMLLVHLLPGQHLGALQQLMGGHTLDGQL